jgi:hypothetical protein
MAAYHIPAQHNAIIYASKQSDIRYMLEAVATLGIANNFNERKLAKLVQQVLGDLRDLQCFGQSCGKRREPPPGYPARKKQLLRKADKALRLLKYRSGQPGKSRDKT